ncbi:right-handed parallel beta-helix repeat-containing protein, partial [Porphyromonas gingivicanis]|uniref:right-handed parallel beta-helix repeat-containing protein n=1 Tax=Porphyromonas gingivicanis TaxID=266762 RepID=UPI00068AFDFE
MKVQSIKNGAVTIATLFAMLFAFPFMAKAQTRYKLQLAGIQVTSANCNDLSVIEGVSGTVKYDPSSKILTLENATITTNTEQNCISVEEAGVTVAVKGTCKLSALSSFGSSAFYVNKSTTITGSGTFFTESTNSCGVYLSNAPLTIDGCHVEAKGKWGIAGEAATIEESLTLKNATIVAEGHEGSIYDLGSLTLEECEISEPKGAVFNESNHAVCDASGNTIKTKVTIKPTSTLAKYNLHLAEVQVTEANCNDLSVIDGVSGTVKYDPNSNTLTLDNATIDVGDDKNCIFAGKGAIALTIVIKGACKLSSTTWSPLNLWRNTTISGDGELYLESKEGRSINLDEGVTL